MKSCQTSNFHLHEKLSQLMFMEWGKDLWPGEDTRHTSTKLMTIDDFLVLLQIKTVLKRIK